MAITQIENSITELLKNFSEDSFIFDFLLAYGTPKSTIKRLLGSDHDRLESSGELVLRKKLYFKVTDDELHAMIDTLKSSKDVLKHSPRFIIVTDYETLLAYDTKTEDSLDTELLNITNHYDFFLPLAGMEKATFADENPADVKASLKMAKLYDELQKNNEFKTKEEIHALNVFLTRLLFCYFAEDTNIFPDNAVTSSISSHTQIDGSDVDSYLARLFKIFNTPENKRDANTPAYLSAFPYVNGGLFRDEYKIPKFTTRSRSLLLEVGQLQWSQINPDIFGSMIQAVVTPEHRGGMGMHYTSVPNIMKVIEPLFLDELYSEFEKSYESKTKLQNLLNRLAKIKIFDPACGSGNFLIIAYKKLRELEMSIMQRIDAISRERSFQFSEIKLTQFYGIELDDFAHEVAMLSLWLAEHQMNLEFYKAFGRTSPSLPLHDGGNIVHGNATRVNWEEVCPKNDGDEIYILGNPPYLGARYQEENHRQDLDFVLKKIKGYKRLDYIAVWFYKGAEYIKNVDGKVAFVSTNSICQGEQVVTFWHHIFKKDIEIDFAYQSFKWQNNAKDNAGVTVAIIGLRNISNKSKYLYVDNLKQQVKNINAYLVSGDTIFIEKKSKPISKIQPITNGNRALDDGYFLMNDNEKEEILSQYPEAKKIIKPVVGAVEFLRGIDKWCLWIHDEDLELANSIPPIKKRIDSVREYRLKRDVESENNPADYPHQFLKMKMAKENVLFLPTVSSERREYIPCGFLDKDTVIIDPNFAIYDPEIFIFGIISSKMHMAWMKTISGKLETRYRYSSTLVYNTFPFPNISQKQKDEITELVFGILDEREKHSQKTLAQLYDPDKMPEGLRKAHHALDIAIEKCYRQKPFESDEERLEYLFKMYEEMTEKVK
ncbi:MAG TPA: SAM-dependent methyltransferase [Sulfurospirillum sp. UBA12182]|nr:MAG TPA: SAM-dependent methyltransferase [Sulfurospirillum sp. UBA12182]